MQRPGGAGGESAEHAADPRLADRRVLVVDDDDDIAGVARLALEAAGLLVDRAADGLEALRGIERRAPDLVVLDRRMPGLDGLEICRRIRETSDVPVLMLTSMRGEEDRIAGLEAGADDYLAKPFAPRELVLRVQSILRRTIDRAGPVGDVEAGPFVLRAAARVIERDGRPLALTVREHDLLAFLLRHPNRAFDRAELLSAVWDWTHGDHSTVTVNVRRLREKLEVDPADPRLIRTVRGVGYRLDLPEEHRAD